MPPEPARISFDGDTPARIEQLGYGSSGGDLLSEDPQIRLVERVVPAGHADDVEIIWQELRSATDTVARQAAIMTQVAAKLQESLKERCYPGECGMPYASGRVEEALALLGQPVEA